MSLLVARDRLRGERGELVDPPPDRDHWILVAVVVRTRRPVLGIDQSGSANLEKRHAGRVKSPQQSLLDDGQPAVHGLSREYSETA